VIVVGATNPSAFELLRSELFGLRCFSAPISTDFELNIRKLAIVAVLFENVPQFVLQVLLYNETEDSSIWLIIAMFGSVLMLMTTFIGSMLWYGLAGTYKDVDHEFAATKRRKSMFTKSSILSPREKFSIRMVQTVMFGSTDDLSGSDGAYSEGEEKFRSEL